MGRFIELFQHSRLTQLGWQRLGRLLLPLPLAGVMLVALLALLTGPVIAAGELILSKGVSANPVVAGDPFDYTITVTNQAVGDLLVSITDTVPAGVEVLNTGGAAYANGILTWGNVVVDQGESAQVYFTARVTRAGTVINQDYRASSGGASGVGSPVEVEVIPNDPDRVLIDAEPESVTAGPAQTVQLTITVADAYGNPVPDSTEVALTFNRGKIDGLPPGSVITDVTSGGQLLKTLEVLTVAGTTHITATANGVAAGYATITILPGPPSQINVSATPTTISTDNGQEAVITAVVQDQYGNRVSSLPITFTTNLGFLNDTQTAVTGSTANGQATVRLDGTVAGTATISAEVAGLAAGQTQVYLAPGTPTQLRFNPPSDQTVSVVADGVSAANVELWVLDKHSNKVDTPMVVTFTTSLGTLPGGGTTYSAVTNQGSAPVALTSITRTGTANLAARVYLAGAGTWLNTDRSVQFVAGSPVSVGLTINPPKIVADGSSTTQITAYAYDANQNVVEDVPLTFIFDHARGFLSGVITETTINGYAVRTLRSDTQLGVVPITVTIQGVAQPGLGAVEFTVGPPKSVAIVAQTQQITVANTVPLTLTVFDNFGHVIPNLPITVTTAVGSIQPAAVGTTGSGGVLTRNLFSTQAGVATITVTSYNGAVPASGHTAVTYVAEPPTHAALAANPAQIVADGLTTALITVTVTDQYLNPVAGVTPVLSTTAGTLLDGGGVTNAAGQTTRRLQSTTELTAAIVDVMGLIASPLTVDFVTGPAYSATLKATPNTAYVYGLGVPSEMTLAITVTDRVGHPLANQAMALETSLGWLTGCTNTNANGMLTCLLRSTISGQPVIMVSGVVAQGDTLTFNPGESAASIVISPDGTPSAPVQVTAGVPFTFTAVAKDAYGNVIPSAVFLWGLRDGYPAGSATINLQGVMVGQKSGQMVVRAQSDKGGYDESYTFINPGPAVKGQLTISPKTVPIGTYSDLTLKILDQYNNVIDAYFCPQLKTTLGTVSMGCTSSGTALGTITSITQTGVATLSITNLAQLSGDTVVTFTPGPPVQFRAAAASTQLHANGTDTTAVTITLQDNFGNAVIAGYTVYAINTSLGALACPSKTTDASGKIYCTYTAPATTGFASFSVDYRVDDPLIDNNSDKIEIFIGPPHHLIIDPSGPLTVTAGVTTSLSVAVYDEGNARLPVSSLQYDWFLESQGGSGVFWPMPAQSWQTSFTGQEEGPLKTRVVIRDLEGNIPFVPGTVQFTIKPAPPVEGNILVSPLSVPADGVSPVTVTLDAMEDPYGNFPSDGEVLSVEIGTLPLPKILSGTISSNQLQLSFSSTTRAGTYPITVTNSADQELALTGTPWVTFAPGEPALAQLVSVTPPQIVADGSSTANVTLQVQDLFGNAVTGGWPLTFTTSLGSFPAGGVTDATGRVNGTMHAGLTLGSARITVTSGLSSFVAAGSVPLVAGPPLSATIAASSTTLAAGGNSLPLHITVYDAWDHPVDGAVITPTINPALGWFGGGTTAVDGLVTQLLAPYTQTGVALVGLQGLTVTGNLTYTVIPNVAALAHVTASPSSLTVGETAAFTATVTDAYGNIVPPTPITVASVLSGDIDGLPAPVTRTTAAGTGRIALTLTATNAGTETLGLAGPSGPLSLTPASQAAAFKPDDMIIVTLNHTDSITWMAGDPLRLVASSRDRFYNIIDPWMPYSYIWEQTSDVDTPGYGQFNVVDGYARNVDFVPFKTGQNRLRALNTSFESDYLTVTVVAAAPTEALIAAQSPGVVADNVSTTTISLSNMTDAYGNDVKDGHVITVTVDTRVATGVVSGGKAGVVLTATKKAGTFPIYAASSAGAVNLAGFSTVTFIPGPPASAVVKASATIIPIDSITATLTITAYDKYNNLVSNGTIITASVTKASVGGNNVPTLNGRTTRSITPVALGSGTISVQGENGALFLQGDTKVTFINGDPYFATLTAADTTLTADGSSSTQLDFTLKDALHFPVGSAGTAIITVSRGTVLPTTTTVTDGQFHAILVSEPEVGKVEVEVLFNGAPMTVDGDTVELVPGGAYRAVLTATPKAVRVDTAQQSALQFSLFDEWDNPVLSGTTITFASSIGSVAPLSVTSSGNLVQATLSPGTVAGSVVFTLTASTGSGPLQISGDTVEVLPGDISRIAVMPSVPVWVTAGSSVAFSAIGYDVYDNAASYGPFNWRKVYGSGDGLLTNGVFTGTLAGTLGLQAYTGTVYSPEKAVTVLPGAVYSAVVSANPITVPIGGVPSQLQITLRDKYGNFVANNTSASVTTDLGTLQGTGATKDGVLTRTLLSSQFSGRAHISVNGKAAAGDTIFFSPRAWITGVPATLLADGFSQSEVRVRMLDGNGQPTDTVPDTITTTLGALDPNCAQGADYVYICTLTAGSETGTAHIYVDGFQAEGAITITNGAPAVAYISAEPPYITTHGFNTATLTITVQDAYGHTLTDYNQPLTVSSSLGTLSGSQPTVNGVTRRVLTGDAVAGLALLQVTGLTVSGTKQLEIVQPTARIESNVTYLSADGQNAAQLTVSLLRPGGQVITSVNAPISVTTTLGTLTGAGSMANGVAQRTLTAGTVAGTARFSIANVPTLTGVKQLPIYGPVVQVTASPKAVPADGLSQVLLKFTLQDIYGNTLSHSTTPLSVTTSLGVLSGAASTVNGVTYRALTAADTGGMAQIGVAGLPVRGDDKVQFVGTDVLDGGFDNGLNNWVMGYQATPITASLVYSAAALSGDVIGGVVVQPAEVSAAGSGKMARLGATTPDNTGHAISEVWLKQSLYISPTGVTQASFWYRLLSYDVKVGSEVLGSKEYDPFEVYINGQKVWEDGYDWSYDWQTWYTAGPSSPKDMGWKQGVLDLTPYSGEIISIEFRVPNRQLPADNTWVYLDDISIINRAIDSAGNRVYLPLILR